MKWYWIVLIILGVIVATYITVKLVSKRDSGLDYDWGGEFASDYDEFVRKTKEFFTPQLEWGDSNRAAECISDNDCGPGARCVGGGCENIGPYQNFSFNRLLQGFTPRTVTPGT